ncbi:PTS system, cellobiose-specific IIA component [Vibrio alginolyticus 12G01]|jgi:PTS system cellobiose-specific IIA component|nr:PTS system, cellobiose-specific IIA component [Vibrio alginolyticus 12G01]EEZ83289.1 Phosphotransferase system cellobiose-specific component IIA [Vibrio alginolyticus 40B]
MGRNYRGPIFGEKMMEQELVVMEIICNAGEARSLSYEALRLSREQDFEAADEKLSQARECINKAHLIQTQLIEEDQGEGKVPMTLVMVHAQDHLMTTILAQEMAVEIVALNKKISNK